MAVSDLIASINSVIDSPDELTHEERLELLAASNKLISSIEGPREKTLRIIMAPCQGVALKIAIDMGIFDAAAELSAGGKDIALNDIATKTGGDPLLITRVMRFLVGISLFKEVGVGKWTATPLAAAYVTASPLAQGIIHMIKQNEVIANLPSYFAEKGYKSPSDAYDSPFQYTRKTNLHAFDWLATQPRLQHAFNVIMAMNRSAKGHFWFDYLPVSSKLQAQSPSDVLLVDVGGGAGHDLVSFKNRFPDLQGRLILQDIPIVIDDIAPGALPSGVEAMKHDFFAAQPVKGAKAYFLSNVLHDWPDKQASQILINIRDAMDKDSLLLVSENLLPETGVSLYSAAADFVMMANFSALERTEEQFRTLFDSVGLELVKAWGLENVAGEESRRVLEVKLKSA
ncbi:S-adenosyl-L-methionine-dependent methyltransferase [Xylogone sp. PMI_703]|nr:S-adenosyl-L-methionine-dependent methyltransferase [Xylogone sp. PMI_703]